MAKIPDELGDAEQRVRRFNYYLWALKYIRTQCSRDNILDKIRLFKYSIDISHSLLKHSHLQNFIGNWKAIISVKKKREKYNVYN